MTEVRDVPAPTSSRSPKRVLLWGLLLAFLLAGFVSGFASGSPDGLEKVAEDEGFLGTAQDSAVSGFPLADYAVAGIDNERLAGGLAGVIGVVLTVAVGTLLFWVVTRLGKGRARGSADSAA